MKAEIVLDCWNQHGEGVLWNALDSRLWWTDIHGKTLWTFDPVTGASATYPAPERICCFAPRKDGTVLAAFADGFALFDPKSGRREDIGPFEPNMPTTRLNDGRTDRQGRFVAGGMDEKNLAPISSVWRVDGNLKLTRLFGEVACANSTCFSPDGRTMYFADSPQRAMVAFAYDPDTGDIGEKRTVATIPAGKGVPDGSCVDSEGFIWNAVWDGYRIERFAPDGRVDCTIEVPVARPTCVAFGGADLSTLFITTSRLDYSPESLALEPDAGSLFAVRPGVMGIIDSPFAG